MSALSSEVSANQENPIFRVKSPVELLQDIAANFDSTNKSLSELTYSDQPRFSHTVHNLLNKHFHDQHKSEWASGTDHAIAPPLPLQWVSSRLDTYYKTVFKGDGDKVHEKTVQILRDKNIPFAEHMATALPEISAAMEIKKLLKNAGDEVAADAVTDLLTVYGITIYYIRDKQAKIRKLEKESADRAKQAFDNA